MRQEQKKERTSSYTVLGCLKVTKCESCAACAPVRSSIQNTCSCGISASWNGSDDTEQFRAFLTVHDTDPCQSCVPGS